MKKTMRSKLRITVMTSSVNVRFGTLQSKNFIGLIRDALPFSDWKQTDP